MPTSTSGYIIGRVSFMYAFAAMKLVISHGTICIQWFPLKSGEWTNPSICCESAIDYFMCPGTTALGINLGVFCTAALLLSFFHQPGRVCFAFPIQHRGEGEWGVSVSKPKSFVAMAGFVRVGHISIPR